MLHEIYYNIGIVEVEDQIDVTKQLIDLYPFIDKSRVAIWGWSYGGFVTASVLARDADQDNIFQCGISVAPVTNWIYYDSIYTERLVVGWLYNSDYKANILDTLVFQPLRTTWPVTRLATQWPRPRSWSTRSIGWCTGLKLTISTTSSP